MPDHKPNEHLPFFTYGIFRPGEISFLTIQDHVANVVPLTIKGYLNLRDGVVLFKNGQSDIDGFLLTFKPGQSEAAYECITNLEPKRLYRWGIYKHDEKMEFNILYGKSSNRGSESIYELPDYNGTFSNWDDPYFNTAFKMFNDDVFNDKKVGDFRHDNLMPLFKLQMKYLFLWTIIERFTFLRYGLGLSVSSRNKKLAEDKHFKKAMKKFVNFEDTNRKIYSARRPEIVYRIDKSDPKKCIQYYYQIRSNIIHRGKAISKDFKIVKMAFDELLNITKCIIKETRLECETINRIYTGSDTEL